MKYKIYITDYDFNSIEEIKDTLSTFNCEFIDLQTKDENTLLKSLSDADGIIVQYSKITPKILDAMTKCKVISRLGIGVDMVDTKYAASKGILVCNVPNYCIDEVADHTLALILSIARKIIPLNNSVKKGIWDAIGVSKPIFNLKKQVLGIIGFGKIPQNLYAKVKQIFGDVIVFDPYVSKDIIEKYDINLVTFYNILRSSDIIVILCPLTDETKYLFDINQFYLMKKNSFIVNTSRGAIINTSSLYYALKNNLIAGASLDVLEQEPPGIDNELLKFENTIITPHIAYYSEESLSELKRLAALNVIKVLKGETPVNVINL